MNNDPYYFIETLKANKTRTMIFVLFAFLIGIVTGYVINTIIFSNRIVIHNDNIDSVEKSNDSCNVITITPNDSLTLDYECIQRLLTKHKVKFSHIVLAQIFIESSNLSYLPRVKDFNLLGMKVAAQRYCFASNWWDFGNFAKYKDIEDCIRDYKSWQIQNAFHIHDEESYYNLLQNIYGFENPNYKQVIKSTVSVVKRKLNK